MVRTKIIISVLLLISTALNIRMCILFSSSHDDFVVSMSESLHLERKVLQNLDSGNIEQAKSILIESVGNKALYVGICLENDCASNEALTKLRAKP